MTRFTWAALASLLLIVVSSSNAQAQWFEDQNPWVPYVSGTVQGAMMDLESGGFNTLGPHFNFDNDRSDEYVLGGAIGVSQDHGRFRTRAEVEGMWWSDQEDLVTQSFPGPPPPALFFYNTDVDNNWSVLGNLWIDLYANEYLAWYLGGGMGAAGAHLTTNDTVVAGEGTDQDFAWMVGTGLLLNMSENCEVDFGYRYYDLGRTEVNLNEIIGGLPAGEYYVDRESHNIALTLRYYLYE